MKKFSEHLFDTVDQMEIERTAPELRGFVMALTDYMDTVVCPELEKLAGGAPAKPRECKCERMAEEDYISDCNRRRLVKVELVVRDDKCGQVMPRAVYEDSRGRKYELVINNAFNDWEEAEASIGRLVAEAKEMETE